MQLSVWDFSGWCSLRLIDLAKKFHLMTLIGLGRLTYRGHLFPDDDLRVFGEKSELHDEFRNEFIDLSQTKNVKSNERNRVIQYFLIAACMSVKTIQ